MASKIILIGGCCATGKSTFSRVLSAHLRIPCFSKDTLKEHMGDAFNKECAQMLAHGSSATFNVMLHIAEMHLQTGAPCILESNFKNIETGQLRALITQYNADCLSYAFMGDLHKLYDRYISRDESGARHWVHSTGAALGRDNFVNGHLYWEMDRVNIGKVIRVNATDFANVSHPALLALAEEFMEANV